MTTIHENISQKLWLPQKHIHRDSEMLLSAFWYFLNEKSFVSFVSCVWEEKRQTNLFIGDYLQSKPHWTCEASHTASKLYANESLEAQQVHTNMSWSGHAWTLISDKNNERVYINLSSVCSSSSLSREFIRSTLKYPQVEDEFVL